MCNGDYYNYCIVLTYSHIPTIIVVISGAWLAICSYVLTKIMPSEILNLCSVATLRLYVNM